MIELSALKPFAMGGRRECYVHPAFPERCIKVPRPEFAPDKLRKKNRWWRSLRKSTSSFNENISDWKVLHRLEKSGDEDIWAHIPRCHGWEETDRGPGLVIELLRDSDGLISRTLLDWAWENGECPVLGDTVEELAVYWESRTIPSRSLGLHNIVMQELGDGKHRLVVIDGLGSTEFFPFSRCSRRYALRRSRSKIQRLRRDLADLLKKREEKQSPGHRGFLLSRQ